MSSLQDNNIRYVALNTLARVVGVDTQAVQRHRATVVLCVKDADVSIRRRALELVYALVNESNIQALTTELLDYLKVRGLRQRLQNSVSGQTRLSGHRRLGGRIGCSFPVEQSHKAGCGIGGTDCRGPPWPLHSE